MFDANNFIKEIIEDEKLFAQALGADIESYEESGNPNAAKSTHAVDCETDQGLAAFYNLHGMKMPEKGSMPQNENEVPVLDTQKACLNVARTKVGRK